MKTLKVRITSPVIAGGMNEFQGILLASPGDILELPVSLGASFSRSVLTGDTPIIVVKIPYGGRYSALLYEHKDFEVVRPACLSCGQPMNAHDEACEDAEAPAV